MTVPEWLPGALKLGLERAVPRPRHDDLVITFNAEKKTGWPFPVRVLVENTAAAAAPGQRYLLGVTRINAKVFIGDSVSPKCATMSEANLTQPKGQPVMPAVELSPRAVTALMTVKNSGPCTASVVAEAIQPGSDSRGAAQTLRRLIADTGYVERNDKGCYKITSKGRAYVNRLQKSQGSAEPETSEPAVD
jgi:hypothetical protein